MSNRFDTMKMQGIEVHGMMSAPAQYVDSISQILVGWPQVKFVFHEIIAPTHKEDPHVEIRKASLILTMPTLEALNMAKMLIKTIKNSQDQMRAISQEQHDKLQQAIASLDELKGPSED